MAGPDSIRGFNFQHARALHAALDLLEDPALAALEVEGDDDVIDYQLFDAHGKRRVVSQVKSRNAPPWWTPGEIKAVILRWADLHEADIAQFQFLSDGAPGPDVARKLQPALSRLRTGQAQPEDMTYLGEQKLDGHVDLLRRVQIALQEPPVGSLLDNAELRVLKILQGRKHASPNDAEAIVDRLFRAISVMGGAAKRRSRRLSRAEVAELVGVDLNDLDRREPWSAELADRVRAAARATDQPDAFIDLGLTPVPFLARSLGLVAGAKQTGGQLTRSLGEMRDDAAGAALTGPSGTGKSTALRELMRLVANGDGVPVLLEPGEYQAGTVFRLVWRQLEATAKTAISAGAVEAWLGSSQAVLLVDGLTERPALEAETLLGDLQTLSTDWRQLRLYVCARQPAPVRRLGLPMYALTELTREQQDGIATELLGDDALALIRRLRTSLDDALANPLLLRMALSVASSGVEPDSVYALYDEFLLGLVQRSARPASDLALSALGLSTLVLVAEARFTADRHWWRHQLAAAINELERLRLFGPAQVTAETLLEQLLAAGMLRSSGSGREIALLHDSFRDFFASRSVVERAAEIPRPLDQRYERVALYLAEAAEPSERLLQALCDNPIAASAACRFDPQPSGETLALAEQLLSQLLSTHALTHTAATVHLVSRLGANHVYVSVRSGDRRSSRADDDVDLAKDAIVVLSIARESGPLRIAVLCWQELLRIGLDELRSRSRPTPIPTTPADLASAIVDHFLTARAELERLSTRTCASLTDRIRDEVRWRGLKAAVSPNSVRSRLDGEIMHPLAWTNDTEEVDAYVGELADDYMSARNGFAESYLLDAPSDEALRQLDKALGRLLPTWGPS